MRRQALLRQAAPFFANWHAEAQRQLQQLRLRLQPYFVAWREFAGLHRLLFIKVCSGGALPCSSTRLIQWQSGKAERAIIADFTLSKITVHSSFPARQCSHSC